MILAMLITGGMFNEKGRIKGNVKDEQGQPVEKAKVKPEPKEAQVSDTTEVETDVDGDFTTEPLENGLYGLSVTKEGYLQKLKDITLNFSLFSNGEGFNCSNNIDIDVTLEKEETPSESNISTKLIVTASPISIPANGTSTSMITAMICDDSNLLVTTATNQIIFTMSGVGTIISQTSVNASNGIATAILKSGLTAISTTTITSSSSGLTEGTVNVVMDKPCELVYVAVYNSPSTNILGLAWDGSNLWSINWNKTVYKHNMDATLSIANTYVFSTAASLYGITWANNTIYTFDAGKAEAYRHNMDSTLSKMTTFGSLVGSVDTGLVWDGSNFWIADCVGTNDKIYKLNSSFNLLTTYNTGVAEYGITWDGNNLWTCDVGNSVYLRNMDSTLSVNSSYIVATLSPVGLAWDGTNLWISSEVEDKIYKYRVIYK